MEDNYIFHVHTSRCGHAEIIDDEEYVKMAISMGADSITFTDHAPFPNNPFLNRMSYEQLPDYLSLLTNLKEKYQGKITIRTGLEIEYFPTYHSFYELLREEKKLDTLVLGQHIYLCSDGRYSFEKQDKAEELKELAEATVKGIETGYFDVVAHPDRIFRRKHVWTEEMQMYSKDIINAAVEKNIPLEVNYASLGRKYCYWKEFWQMIPKNHAVIYGCDAHALNELHTADVIRYAAENKIIKRNRHR